MSRRRVPAALGAAALMALALPAVPAFASATSTVGFLDATDADVLPGVVNVFDIKVTSGETAGTLGLGAGKSINAVRVILPTLAGITTQPVAADAIPGWTTTRTSSNGLERYDLKATGAGIAPGASFTFPLPGLVARPATGDRSDAFQVGASSDAGSTYKSATGSLTTTVHTLLVKSLAVVDGPGQNVADGTGTAGQTVNAAVAVQNLASGAQTVTPALASNDTSTPDTIAAPAAASVPGYTGTAPGSYTFTVPVTLGKVTADKGRTFTATATAAKSSATKAPFIQTLAYTAQVAPTYTLDKASFAPVAVNGRTSNAFSVAANKLGTPTLSQGAGTLTFRSVSNGATSAPIALQAPVAFGPSTNKQTLTFTTTQLNAANLLDGKFDAVFSGSGTDGNGFPVAAGTFAQTLTSVLSLDNLGPIVTTAVTLPNDKDGDKTTAARDYNASDNNVITVTGDATDSVAPILDSVSLECTSTTLSIAPINKPTVVVSGSKVTYTANFQPKFGACTTFDAVARFADAAGNPGDATSSLITVDNIVPSVSTADRKIKGSVGLYPFVDAAKSSILVNIDDNTLTTGNTATGVIGGCDAGAWKVDGQLLVQAVWYVGNDGTPVECTTGASGKPAHTARPANNQRYLKLTSDIARGSTQPQPTVTYSSSRTSPFADPFKDAAGNIGLDGTQDTLNNLVPAAPVLVSATRNARAETAYNDGTSFFTRFSGEDFKVTVSGGLNGDTIQLLKAGSPVKSTTVVSGGGELGVPVEATEGVHPGLLGPLHQRRRHPRRPDALQGGLRRHPPDRSLDGEDRRDDGDGHLQGAGPRRQRRRQLERLRDGDRRERRPRPRLPRREQRDRRRCEPYPRRRPRLGPVRRRPLPVPERHGLHGLRRQQAGAVHPGERRLARPAPRTTKHHSARGGPDERVRSPAGVRGTRRQRKDSECSAAAAPVLDDARRGSASGPSCWAPWCSSRPDRPPLPRR